MDSALNGWIIGGIIWLLIGPASIYFSIKETHGPRERLFMIRSSVFVWLALGAFFSCSLLFPSAHSWILVPFPMVLLFGFIYLERKQKAIRQSEQRAEAND